jgi:hypothetical protein
MTRRIRFYARANDLGSLISSLETQKNLQYTRTGLFDTSMPETCLALSASTPPEHDLKVS